MYTSFSGQKPLAKEKRNYIVFDAIKYQENKPLFDDVSCQKCSEITVKMRQCAKCQNVYCSECFDTKTIGYIKCCPNCSSKEEDRLPNQRLMTLNSMFFKCPYSSNGCATCMNVESLSVHEETCPFKDSNSKYLANSSYPCSSSTLAYSNSQSVPLSSILVDRSSIVYSPTKQSHTKEEMVPLSVFIQLQNEFKVLYQLCAANFKGRCNNGHDLIYESRDSNITSQVICDVCKREPTTQSTGSYRCGACDFDRCEKCYQQNRLF